MKNLFLYLFIGAALFNIWQYGFWNGENKDLKKQIEISKKTNLTYKDSITKLNDVLAEANYFSLETNQNAIDYLEDYDLKVLLPKIKEEINNLNSSPKGNALVPLDPIDGNKFVINRVKFLNHRWLVGDFSNGEIWGEVILKYFINDDETVSFETAESVIYSN